MQGLCTIVQHDKKCQPSPKTRKFASKMLAKHALTIPGLSAARDLRFGRASANSSIKKRGHTQYEFDPLLSVLPNPRPTLPFQRRQHPRQLFLTAYLSPLSNCGPSNGAAFLRCHLEDCPACGPERDLPNERIAAGMSRIAASASTTGVPVARPLEQPFHFIHRKNLINF